MPASTLRLVILVIFTSFAYCGLNGQCENLGENIFTDGDFGSGTDNVVPVDPGIAPGFTYQPFPPPNDGFYTITNNTGGPRWNSIFGTWSRFRDNSNDPNGYMMIVNANFTPGKFYEQRVDGLCENTEYQFAVDVRNVLAPGPPGLFPDVAFLIDGVVRDSTDNVPQDGAWHTYDLTFSTMPGQTSVLLTLANNNPGGLGNDLAIDNISFRACGPQAQIEGARTTVDACLGGDPPILISEIIGDQYPTPAFQWQRSLDGGLTWEDIPGENSDRYQAPMLPVGRHPFRYLVAAAPSNINNNKCRVTSTIVEVNVQPLEFTIIDTICAGLSFPVGNSAYTESGVYRDDLISSLGCDSTVITQLTVVPDPGLVPNFQVNDTRCSDVTDGSVLLLDVAGAAPPFTLTFDDKFAAGRIDSLAPGPYSYSITDRFGCAAAGAVEVGSPAPFVVDLGPDLEVELGDEVAVFPNSNYGISSLTYSPPVPGCEMGCDDLLFTPTSTLNLRLLALSDTGCVAVDSLEIVVVKNREVYFPNSFSPNGDGVNDDFAPFTRASRIVAVSYLRVFDRWGSLVFEAENIPANELSAGWDGKIGEELAPPGSYVYASEVLYVDGESRRFSGSLMLLR
ncbi:gliding motility-associated C-terminal domain-containing protein [Lewinella sp. 4G2]|uniref:T9SS type B sorting domain-containing protein n=1 Tax=Lewinella sp. 4G2 TaxID=1803372 RepID=UPI0007B48282|nr:gliding motility-associated C-terminal domain-containing protein [Lewinella sp. 4G2]OAV44358.1 hypothetical protein A3850_007555 [Lewinella sp. 4G2]